MRGKRKGDMTETPLPSRDSFKRIGVTLMDATPILAAYVRDELRTEAEWREGLERVYLANGSPAWREVEADD